jgi:hypothetical protein
MVVNISKKGNTSIYIITTLLVLFFLTLVSAKSIALKAQKFSIAEGKSA